MNVEAPELCEHEFTDDNAIVVSFAAAPPEPHGDDCRCQCCDPDDARERQRELAGYRRSA